MYKYLIIFISVICLATVAWAQDPQVTAVTSISAQASVAEPEPSENRVRLLFRTISANSDKTLEAEDPSLLDLDDNLDSLPYKNFKLLHAQEIVFPIGKKQSLTIGDGDTVTLKVLYQNEHRVGIWYNWSDDQDHELIDTKLHFSCKKSFVTVVDAGNGQGKLLAIKLIQ